MATAGGPRSPFLPAGFRIQRPLLAFQPALWGSWVISPRLTLLGGPAGPVGAQGWGLACSQPPPGKGSP